MEVDKGKAFELFTNGMSVNAVAGALKTTWYIASQLKSAWLTQQAAERPRETAVVTGLNPGEIFNPTNAPEPEAEPASTAPDDSVSESWDITLSVPSDRVADIFATFTTQEKFDAIGYVLQRRMDDALNA